MTAALLALSGCALDPEPSETPDHPPRRLAERPKDLDGSKGSSNDKDAAEQNASDDPT